MKIDRQDDESELSPNMTPLIDMLFILIIFFLATSRFQQEERDQSIQLVRSSSDTLPITAPSRLLIIDIDRDGRKRIHGRERTLEEIEEVIRSQIEEGSGAEVVVRADKRSTVVYLAETLEICHRLGIKTPNVSYEASGDALGGRRE